MPGLGGVGIHIDYFKNILFYFFDVKNYHVCENQTWCA